MLNTELMKDFYRRYPDYFMEDHLGVKLHLYQRIMLRLMFIGIDAKGKKLH